MKQQKEKEKECLCNSLVLSLSPLQRQSILLVVVKRRAVSGHTWSGTLPVIGHCASVSSSSRGFSGEAFSRTTTPDTHTGNTAKTHQPPPTTCLQFYHLLFQVFSFTCVPKCVCVCVWVETLWFYSSLNFIFNLKLTSAQSNIQWYYITCAAKIRRGTSIHSQPPPRLI